MTESRIEKKYRLEYEKQAVHDASSLWRFEEVLKGFAGQRWELVALRILPPTGERADWLVVAKFTTPNGEYVGFGGGATFTTAIVSTINRLGNGQVKFREDQPYGG